MKINLKNRHRILGAIFLLLASSLSFPALADSIQVNGKDYTILDALPIVINRNETDKSPMTYTRVSSDRRYRLIEFMPALTQERRESPEPAARQLYRLAKVEDTQSGRTLEVALPIRFQP